MHHETEVDAYGMPVAAFGDRVPSGFFEVLGRILSAHGKIEYLKERLNHLPADETTGVRKVEQFHERFRSEQAARNTIVHSHWMFGAHNTNPDVILALRYRTRNNTPGEVATVSIVDVPESDEEQIIGQYTLDHLKKILARSIVTMRIGEQAYSDIMLRWASRQTDIVLHSDPAADGGAV
jgi:hypothetical protein